MPNTRELRRRIKSIKNTSQITKAMQMVSATKMRRAQNQAVQGRPYSSTLENALSLVSGKIDPTLHPLLSSNDSNKIAVIVITTDKGLCGALNTNVFRTVMNNPVLNDKAVDVDYYSIGKKGRDFIVRTGRNLVADFENPEKVTSSQAVKIRKVLLNSFLNKEIKEGYILYPDFVSTLRQEPKLVKVLPVSGSFTQGTETTETLGDFVFEPSPDAVLDFALIHQIDTLVYQALLETKASEHSARMIAMQNATNNAKDLVSDLTLTYNQVRQSAITTELLEITSAAAALE